jgi:peptidoglycan/LPS O-acetylase OafA/YrhL
VQDWGLAAYLIAAAALSFLSQRLVERPILRLRRKLRPH